MEQPRGEPQEEEQPPTLSRCPRCNSLDTKFRYFNNHSFTQPRYYCKTCKRQWTVGGNLRYIPVGGKTRSSKQTKVSSSRCGNSRCQPPQPPLPFGEARLQNSQSPTPIVPQIFHTTMIQQPNSPPQISYYFNDEISCLDAIQSLIQPEIINQHVNAGNRLSRGGDNMETPRERKIQSMASQKAFPQQIYRYNESHQNYNQANSLVQSTWPTNFLPQDISTSFGVSASNASLWNNFRGNTIKEEMDRTSVNIDEWLNLSEDDSL
ncbi:hypothetical protein OROGR_007767 [Orobanche gracilis]